MALIKSVVVPCPVASEAELQRLRDALFAFGFRMEQGWKDARSTGTPLLTGIGGLELVYGQLPAASDLLVETDDVHGLFQKAQELGLEVVCEVQESHWGCELFIFQIGGMRVAFFEFKEAA